MTDCESRILALFAELLTYPMSDLAAVAGECRALVGGNCPDAAGHLAEFQQFAASSPRSLLEEFYTSTFDFSDACQPYLGGKLFGESYKRSLLLVGLVQCYRQHGFDPGSEIPDHMAVVLRFLSTAWHSPDADEIADHALLPVLEKIVAGLEAAEERPLEVRARRVYGLVLRALHLWLAQARANAGDARVAAETAG
jgi:nitrate reductase molybdenum cofactor assembly chaperone NarJ/NarW